MCDAGSVRCSSAVPSGERCRRTTSRGHKCAQHLRMEDGLQVAPSCIAEAGLGLFTTISRRKGDHIAQYTGKYVHLNEADDGYGGIYVLQLTRTLFIDAAAPSSGAARYSNTARPHNIAQKQSRGNNAHFSYNRHQAIAWIVATRDIDAGEEVFTAYGRAYHIPSPLRGQMHAAIKA